MKKLNFTLMILLLAMQGMAQSAVTITTTTEKSVLTDFCTGLQKILADYPNDFINIRGKRLPAEKTVVFGVETEKDPYAYEAEITPGKVVKANVNILIGGKHGYSATIVDGITSADIANWYFDETKKMIEQCAFPFILRSVDAQDDHVTFVVEGTDQYRGMQIMLRILDDLLTGEFRLVLNVNPTT